MSSWTKRMLTVLAGAGIGVVGVLIPATAAFTIPAATALVGWAVRHPADKDNTDEK